jgi:hypothetical protein
VSDRRRATFFTTGACLMCDEAWSAVTAMAPFLGITVTQVDISDDPVAASAYGERVPVLVNRGRVVLEGPMTRRAVGLAMLGMWMSR